MRKLLTVAFLASGVLGIHDRTASAGLIVQWATGSGGNGHNYEFVSAEGLSWQQADSAANAMSYRGSVGHLVTVTNQGENDFLKATFGNLIGDPSPPPDHHMIVPGVFAWIGLTDEGTPGTFHWVTGESLGYSNWGRGEPSTAAGYPDQDYVILWQRDYGNGPAFSWNDDFDNPTSRGLAGYGSYLVEFDGPFAPAPAPSTLVMFSITFAMFGVGRACKRLKRRAVS